MKVRVDDFNPGRGLDIACSDLTLALCGQVERLGTFGLDAKHDLLEVQDEVDDVFDDAFDRREFMLDAFDAYRRDRRTRDPGQQRSPHCVSERVAETGLERFNDEP